MVPAVAAAAQDKDEDAVVEGEGDVPDGQGDPVAPLLSCLHFSRFPVLLLVHFLLSLSLSAALVGGTSQAQEEKEKEGKRRGGREREEAQKSESEKGQRRGGETSSSTSSFALRAKSKEKKKGDLGRKHD